MALTRQQLTENIEALEGQGASQTDIQEYINQQSIQEALKSPTQSKSLFRPAELVGSIIGGAKEEFGGAAQDIAGAQLRQEKGEQGGLRTAFTSIAQGAQAGLGTTLRGLLDIGSALLPDFIEDPIRRKLGTGFDNFIASPKGQEVVSSIKNISDKIDTLSPKNQQLIKDIVDAALTGIDIASFGVGGKIVTRGAAKVGAKAGVKGEKLIIGAEKDVVQQVEKKLGDLIIDTSTPTGRAKVATRTKEGGFFTGRDVVLTTSEKNIVGELIQTPGIKANRSALFNLNAVTPAIIKEAKQLKASLKENNFIFPKQESLARLKKQLDNLKKTDTDVIGDAEKLADRIFDKMKVFVNDSDGTGLGALSARQNFDRWVTSKRPKAFEKQDSFNTIVRSARNTVNNFLEEKATKTNVKKSLQRQSRLLNAEDVLKTKAGKESSTGFVRLLDRATEKLGTKNRIVQLIAAVVGIGGLGAAATFAPAAAAVGGTIGVAALLIKALRSPAARKKLGQILLLIEKALPKAKGEEKAILLELQDEIKALLQRDSSIGLSVEDISGGSAKFKELVKRKDEILNNKLLSEKQKQKSIDDIDKQLGLTQ